MLQVIQQLVQAVAKIGTLQVFSVSQIMSLLFLIVMNMGHFLGHYELFFLLVLIDL